MVSRYLSMVQKNIQSWEFLYYGFQDQCSELKTLELDILNLDRLVNLEIKKKRRSRIDLDIHHFKIFSSVSIFC